MVGDTATTTVASQPPPYQTHAYTKSNPTNYTPVGSGATTPMNVSPTSPRSASHFLMHPHHAPQIRRPKNPIYVPAALRRTEKPVRQSPPLADSVVDTPTASSWASGPGTGPAAPTGTPNPLSLITSEDLSSIYSDVALSPITGPITRNHWQPDGSTNVCTASACQTPFGFFNRRHHCRKCGGIFCWQHTQRQVRLNEHALFHPEGEWQRACDRCYTQYRQWEQMRTSRQNSDSSGSTGARGINTPTQPAALRRPDARVGSIQNSFSGAWNWSTF